MEKGHKIAESKTIQVKATNVQHACSNLHAQGIHYLCAEKLLGLSVILHIGLWARSQQNRVQYRAEGEQTAEQNTQPTD